MKSTSIVALVLLGSLVGLEAAEFQIKSSREFFKCVPRTAKLKKLAGGMQFVEGPVWIPEEGLIFSDIPANEIKRWRRDEGVITYRAPSYNANGNTLDNDGRVVTCEHSSRRVSIEEFGVLRPLVETYNGKRFNSPNDVVVKMDGTVWFTDPDYGLRGAPKEQDGNYVFRYDPKSGVVMPVIKDCDKPNGLCFSPEETKLYVADSGKPHHIRVFDVQPDGTVSNGRVFCVIDKGAPDGIRCDNWGHVWSTAGDGVHIYAKNGSLIGKILTPETPSNLCFGGKFERKLFITARTSLYEIDTLAKMAHKPVLTMEMPKLSNF